MAAETLAALPRSKVGGDALDLPVPVADGVEFPAAAARLRRPLCRRAVAFGAADGGLGERARGCRREGIFRRRSGRRIRFWIAHSFYMSPAAPDQGLPGGVTKGPLATGPDQPNILGTMSNRLRREGVC